MAVKAEKGEAGTVKAPALVRVRFVAPWSSDRGYFAHGSEAELPEEIAQSLLDERMVEVL